MSIKSSFPTDSPSLVLDFANSRKLDPRVSFDRASTGNTASYMGPDGYIKYAGPDEPRFDHRYVARTNLIPYSEDFSTAWSSGEVTITTDQIANPLDGATTADKYVATTTLDRHRVQQSIGSEIGIEYTGSVYVKSAGADTVSLRIGRSSDVDSVLFNILSGTVISEGSSITSSSIENVGGGWFRIAITNTPAITGTQYFVISEDEQTANFSGDGVNGFYFWGAQLEKNDTATAYIPTTSTSAIDTRIESMGLLTEEQRTNYSNTFNSSTNQLTSINSAYLDITSTSDINPNGSSAVAYTATYNAPGTQFHGFPASKAYTGVTTNKTISHSYFIKEFNNSDYRLYFTLNARNATTTDSNYVLARFRPRTGEFISLSAGSSWTGVSTKVEEYPNGWYRATVTATYVAEPGRENIDLAAQLLNENQQQFYNPPSANTHGLFIWGPQVEEAQFPGSYIPTNGGAVTRPRDRAGVTGSNFSNFYNQNEGTFQVTTTSSYGPGPSGGFPRVLMVCDNANNQNNCIQYYYSNSSNSFGYAIWEGSSSRWSAQGVISDGESNDAIIAYSSANNPNVTVDGVRRNGSYNTSPYIHPTALIRIWIGSINGFGVVPQQHTSKVAYYPIRLSDTQLKELTK